jgi:hypothetical protein
MDVNVKRAVKMFFSKSSFEMIYFEAFANAIDAKATEFGIHISLPEASDWSNMRIELTDNGVGFTDERFRKFNKLLDVEERSHKGLGRLVYLCYFDRVLVESVYEPRCLRKFEFNEDFDGQNEIVQTQQEITSSKLIFMGFNGERIGKTDYVKPSYIKNVLLEYFYMKFYKAKQVGQPLTVSISLTVCGVTTTETINSDTIPEFHVKKLDERVNLFDNITLYYYIHELDNLSERQIITALAVDDRSHVVTIIADENIPLGYEMVFLLMSETFQGHIDVTRQNLTIEEPTLNQIKIIFRDAIASIINEQFPRIAEANTQRKQNLEKRYPHLSGYFEDKEIGYSTQSDVLKKAQEKYFRDQKEVLGATVLTDEQFEKSMDLSARALAEYILFRQNVIDKMRSFNGEEKEAEVHNLLAPKGAEFREGELMKDLYCNNVWVLDEKFMSYCTVLSEAEMSKVVDVLTAGEVNDNDNDRPDIVLFFSGDPTQELAMVDVVVVELKRLGISAEKNSIVEFQLDTRTQRLAEYYGNRIQRMWFYGIVDFDDRYETHLVNNGFNPLFSNGSVYFRSKTVYTDKTKKFGVIQNAYIMDFTALVEDASSRNETFLKILKSNFK